MTKNNSNKSNKSNKLNTNNNNNSIFSPLFNGIQYFNNHVMYLNNSKFFAGIIMILLNVGSKFITIQFSKSTEEYMKYTVSKQLLVFSMAWMGTRDIYASLLLTAAFTILSDHLFNEDSQYCVVPEKYRVLAKLVDANNDGKVSETEINSAIAVLEKAKKEKQRQKQKEAFTMYHEYMPDEYKNIK